MKHHLNTLFVMTQGAYLKKDGETIVVRVEKEDRLRLPMINVGAIVCMGRIPSRYRSSATRAGVRI